MADMIRDGAGSSFLAAVNSDNKLEVSAVITPTLLWHSLNDGDVFSTYNKHTIQVNDTEEKVCSLTYTGDASLIVNKLLVSCNDPTNLCKFEVYVDATTIGGGVAVTPSNWNRTSAKSISVTTLHTNSGASPITTADDGTEIMCFYSKAGEGLTEVMMDGLVLGRNDNVLVIAENKAAGKVGVTMHYYEL